MADDNPPCDICGLPSMATYVANMLVTETLVIYASCPQHVDTAIARMQDTLHETMANQDGALHDWWDPIINSPAAVRDDEEPAP